MADDKRVAVLGAGMHEWGKWGRPFVEYGLAAARDALNDAGLTWRDMQFVSGADTIRNGYPGFVSGATFAQALGWTGARVSSVYAACASGAVAIANARGTDPRWPVRRRFGCRCRHHTEGLLRPGRRRSQRRPRLASLPPHGRYESHVFRVVCATPDGSLRCDGGGLRSGQGEERAARACESVRALPQGGLGRRGARLTHGGRSAAAPRDLRHLRRRRCARAFEHGLRAPSFGWGDTPRHHRRRFDGHAFVSQHRDRDAELRDGLGGGRVGVFGARQPSAGSGPPSPLLPTPRPG